MKLQALIDDIHERIRKGDVAGARHALGELGRRRVPRVSALTVARLARRAELPALAIRVLNPIVRPGPRKEADATDEEKAEYAACLTKIGASEEADVLLASLSPEAVPMALLYRAFALITRWDYEGAIPLLDAFAAVRSVEPYWRIVARVNLASAHVYVHHGKQAGKLLDALLEETKRGEHSLLHGHVLDLAAVNAMQEKAWAEAESYLRRAEELASRDEGGARPFFLRKWRAVLEASRKGPKPGAIEGLRAVRREALERRHWETVRDCDRYEATVARDRALLVHLWFGTPFEKFRENMLREFGEPVAIPPEYEWRLGKAGREKAHTLDLFTGEISHGRKLKPGGLVHRTLVSLCADFYRPVRLAALHYRLYPREYYNPVSAPLRVHQALWELRQWIAKARFPLAIEEREGFYRVTTEGDCRIRVRGGAALGAKAPALLDILRREWPAMPFSLSDASERLAVSPRSTLRIVREGIEAGELERSGRAALTRYRFRAR